MRVDKGTELRMPMNGYIIIKLSFNININEVLTTEQHSTIDCVS